MSTAKASFTGVNGVTITFRSVSPFLIDRLRASFQMPEPPTYTATTVTGATETHKHDSDSIQSASPEEKAAYDGYLMSVRQTNVRQQEAFTRLLLSRGVEVDVPANGWVEDQEALGVNVPTEANARKVHYILTEIIGSPDDLVTILGYIMERTGVKKEATDAAMSSFRRATKRGSNHKSDDSAGAVESVGAVRGD